LERVASVGFGVDVVFPPVDGLVELRTTVAVDVVQPVDRRAEDFTVAAGYEMVEVPDVTTGSRYVAVRPACPVGQSCPDTAATSLIRHAQDVLLMVQDPARCPLPDYLTIQGYGCLAAEQANNPRIIEDRRRFWTEIFRDAVRDLDMARSFYGAYGRAF